ncbi:MAG: acetyl/propionyl/methylcrotonyl-CoA carboxylase subunit alpha [Rhodobacterales bacterium]
MFKKILIANRGEIACRIIKTAKRMGVSTVAVYSDADANALHVMLADEAVHIGGSAATDSYLLRDRVIEAALQTGAEAVHPGYGFLSENPEFADKLAKAGLVFIGPSADAIRKMGLKDQAKNLMEQAGVPVVPGYHGTNQDADFLADEAAKIGYPVLIKARAGGGGKGMRLVEKPADFATHLASAQREGKASFGDANVLIEKYITAPRHIEVQVFGDSFGNIVHLFERDCSLQRRHQKVIEEAPAPDMPADVRTVMTQAATRAAAEISYEGAGTIEFIVDGSGPLRTDGFWFMEMNTRLQVEHPVTEAITGQDLVEWQLRVAAGEPLPLSQDQLAINGHAFEARIYAEDPQNDFMPAPGMLTDVRFGTGCRVDTGVRTGDKVSPFYDPMIAKLISHAATRGAALTSLRQGLNETICAGTQTNLTFLSRLCVDADFFQGRLDTGLIGRKGDSLMQPMAAPAFAVLVAALSANSIDPQQQRLGWQLWGRTRQALRLSGITGSLQCEGGCRFTLTLEDGAHVFEAVTNQNGQVTARAGIKNLTALLSCTGSTIMMKQDGEEFYFHAVDPLDVSAAESGNADCVFAPMTGVVSIVHVAAGDTVQKGDALLVLEAMKMEHALCAPRDGVIADVMCKASSAVDEGSQLVVLQEVSE